MASKLKTNSLLHVGCGPYRMKDEPKLEAGRPVTQQLEKIRKELLNSKQWCTADFMRAGVLIIMKPILPDIVKAEDIG